MDLLSVSIDDHTRHNPSHSVFSVPGTPDVFSPSIPFQTDDSRRDDLSTSSSEDSDKDDEFDRERAPGFTRRTG